MDTLKVPLSFGPSGFTKLTEDSDEYYKQLLSVCARTEPGVSPLFPDFGVFDPTFIAGEDGRFLLNAARYIPEISVTELAIDVSNEGTHSINVSFVRR